MQTVVGNNVTAISVQKKKANVILAPIKFLLYIVLAFWMLISVILCFTILGIPLGILSMFGAMGFMAMLRGHYKVTCPHCNHHRNYVSPNALNFSCRKCKNLTVINWYKEERPSHND